MNSVALVVTSILILVVLIVIGYRVSIGIRERCQKGGTDMLPSEGKAQKES